MKAKALASKLFDAGVTFVRSADYRKWILVRIQPHVGYDRTQWSRVVQQRAWKAWLASHPIHDWDALEISPGVQTVWQLPFKSYTSTTYPAFDICTMRLDRTFDVIIADQVFEHLSDPHRAARNVRAMLRPGGAFLVCTPFMLRVHGAPHDYSRWTESGLRRLLDAADFTEIETGAWGNRACIRSELRCRGWSEFAWGRSLRNEPLFPISVWAFAR